MRDLLDIITESQVLEELILEKNEIIYPKNDEHGKCKILIGDHGRQRMEERKVKEKEILDAILGGYKDISQAFADGKIKQVKDPKESSFIVVDARKDKSNPVNVSGFIARSYKNNKLVHPIIIVKTVFRGGDFSGTKADRKNEHKIFLY